MLEQDTASIIKFILDNSGNPSPYYWNVPEDFTVPAAYFPVPEIVTGGETFRTYNVDFTWYIKFFHSTEQKAYAMGYQAAHAIRAARNLIPLLDEEGNEINRKWVRINDPDLKALDDGAAQLTIRWRSRRPYNREDVQQMQGYILNIYNKDA